METIKVTVCVPRAAALAQGRARYGRDEYALTDSDIGNLSPEAKKFLAEPNLPTLEVDLIDSTHVLYAIEAEAARALLATRQKEQDDEEAILKALALDDADWIGTFRDDTPGILEDPSGMYLNGQQRNDPRVIAHRQRLEQSQALADAQQKAAERKENEKRLKAWDEALDAEARKETEACRAALRQVAERFDDLARAARENYPIENQALDFLAKEVVEWVGGWVDGADDGVYSNISTDIYDDPEDRAAPSRVAFALRDKVELACRGVNERLPTTIGKWVTSRIVRVDSCPHKGEHHYVTAVLATLETRAGDREITFSVEPLGCSHHD